MMSFLTDLGVSDFAGGPPPLRAWINNQAWHTLLGLCFALTWWPVNLLLWAVWMTKEITSDIPGAGCSWPIIIDSFTDIAFGSLGAALTYRATSSRRPRNGDQSTWHEITTGQRTPTNGASLHRETQAGPREHGTRSRRPWKTS